MKTAPTETEKTALVTGITGQDGHYLTQLLLQKNYQVVGLIRRASLPNTERLNTFLNHPRLRLVEADLGDSFCLHKIIGDEKPHELYNLGAMSHVGTSFFQPEYAADVNGLGTLRLLEAIRANHLEKHTRFYQASTSELFGKVQTVPQNEKTPFYPRSPYAVAKLYAYWATVNYREAYGIFACNGILFNHESPMRGLNFVTRKITHAVAKICYGQQEVLKVGNLEARRDWGHAQEYVEGMWRMLQADRPSDYVLATGETHTVREFIELAFKHAGLPIRWVGAMGSESEHGVCATSGKVLVEIDPQLKRPAEVDLLVGDASKAREELGWTPKINFEELVKLMMEYDLGLVESQSSREEKRSSLLQESRKDPQNILVEF